MSTQVPAEPRKTPPPWLVPLGIGMILVLLVALIVVLVTDDDNSDSSDASVPVTTVAAGESTVETVPETTAAPTDTTAPAETLPDTTVPATEPATTVPEAVTQGQAQVAAEGSTRAFGIPVVCSDFWAGAQITSHLLVDSVDHHVWVVDVLSFEEGGDRGMQAVDMDFTIAANVFGQDVGVSPTYSGTIDDSNQTAGRTTATLTLTSGDGPASIDVTLGETPVADCAVGTFSELTPFVDTQVEWQSPDSTSGQRFNVLADCGGNLIVSAGGFLLTDYPQDGNPMAAGLVNTHNLIGNDVWWTNLVSPTPEETAFDQGGGGDINAALNVFPDGDRTAPPGYLSWTQRPPRSAVGDAGLLDDVCTQSP